MSDLVFPSDRAKKLRESPQKRYEFAIQYLPLPAAFKEAAKGLRQLIRDARRNGEDYDAVLSDLYSLACLRELVHDLLSESGYGWGDAIPADLWATRSFDYERIGYERLELLGVTDRKWIVEAWGPPDDQMAVRSAHPEVASEILDFLQTSAAKSQMEYKERMRQVASSVNASQSTQDGCIVALFSLPVHFFS